LRKPETVSTKKSNINTDFASFANLATLLSFLFIFLPFKGQDQKRYQMLGERLKELREAKGFVQRQVAALLEVDTAYVSKMERNEKPVSRSHIKKLSKLFEVEEKDLMPLWLADKVLQVVDDEQCAPDALTLVLKELKRK
jgi:transcriptional regulator with XRE-family HTH domain